MVSRRGESGQALLFALLALLIASMAAALVAADLALRERALQEEAARAHVRGLLDGAIADALAREAAHRPLIDEDAWGGGTTTVEKIERPPLQFVLRVTATYKAHRGAAEALVLRTLSGPRVQSWRRLHPGPESGP
jgi:hypothetical protein